jgi:sigma-B regulation protein RsbU (phosphoserine phosphatase)
MEIRLTHSEIKKSAGPVRRIFDYAFYDWTREMPRWKRVVTWTGIMIQAYAIYAGIMHSLVWPLIWPRGIALYPIVFLLYLLGNGMMNGMLTMEFMRKTQLESDQIAARQIQQTLIPQTVDEVPGYEVETFYKPLREVGGDYFDVIGLPGNRTLFALADVSGKGMAAALLASNIQALVRSLASVDADPLKLAVQINHHLSRYTPSNHFATALFLLLARDSGHLTYVNAGHDAPILLGAHSTTRLTATGIPLGILGDAKYQPEAAIVPPGATLLLFTDGLTDSIRGERPEQHLIETLTKSSEQLMSSLKALVNPKFNEDDVTMVLVKRLAFD